MPKITGHRGAKDEWPENTILGIQKAIEAGVSAIEIDIHKTQDNALVVIHDSTLERTTNLQGIVSEMTLEQVRSANAGMGEKVPLLSEVINLCIQSDTHLFIEVKDIRVQTELAELLIEKKVFKNCTVICFNHTFIKNLKATLPKVRTGCLMVANPINPHQIVKDANADLLALAIGTLDRSIVQNCHENDISIAVWNANTEDEFQKVKSLKVDYITVSYTHLTLPTILLV